MAKDEATFEITTHAHSCFDPELYVSALYNGDSEYDIVKETTEWFFGEFNDAFLDGNARAKYTL